MGLSSGELCSTWFFNQYHFPVDRGSSQFSQDKIIKQPIEVSSFQGHNTFILGFVNLGLTVELIWAAHPFHVIDSQITYHLLLDRPWIHHNKAVPSTYHQCLKVVWKGKRVNIDATESLFLREDAHLSEATYFDELVDNDEVAPAKPRGTPLPEWYDLEKEEPRVDNSAFTSTGRQRKGRQNKQGNKSTR